MASMYPTAGGPPPGAIPPPAHHVQHQQHQQQQQHQGGGPPPNTPTTAGAAVPESYFTESRKGEVNELRTLLRSFAAERDPQRKRDIIKKVIAYMTLGIDVSRLFTEMMLAIETRDLVIKKMVYLFLCNYATTHPELAQMCTNTLVKDCGNDDPMVRGLALRALCSLRLPQMVEYISEPLRRSLTDGHAYVRKTGVMGILKLYHLDKEAFDSCQFVDILYDMLRDADASVVSNCIIVLNEIMAQSGGMAINRAIMLHLLNRIHEFSEFGVMEVLELIPRYIPANDEEGYQIMNLLDPVLRTSNAGAVLATIRAFLRLAGDDEEMRNQVVTRIKAPLVTLISAGSSELVYCLLQNADALVELCPGMLDDEYRQFYIKHNEPTHVKYLKINILPKIANPDNAPDIVAELSELVAHQDVHMSRLAVRSMARIACRNVGGPGCEQSVARRLVEMLDLNIDHICSEAATALCHILRKHPGLKDAIAPPLPRSLKYIQEATGKASIIYLLGECGDVVPEAPYALENLIDKYDELTDPAIKAALLSSTMKLFFQRPPETQKMLGRLLAKATDDVSSQDLHDRGLLYYRMLQTDPAVVEAAIKTNGTLAESVNFTEDDDVELRNALMKEFNTLSILYGKTSDNFIAEKYRVKYSRMPAEHPLPPGVDPGIVQPMPMVHHQQQHQQQHQQAPPATATSPAAGGGMVMDLLGFGGGAAPSAAPVAPPSGLTLKPVTLSGDEYQAHWGAISDAEATVTAIPVGAIPSSTDQVERTLGAYNVLTMASGELPAEFKFFLYAADEASGELFLIQSNLSKGGEPLLIVTVKATGPTAAGKMDQLVEIIRNALS
mmetsp:Transcript_29624/g.48881  ORF Transcript_29624/g.48881 Transcript_29624/m.48881 type:complete len:838 (+) Transcript_29624:214-2727(+)|eukprot:CAMPEP_0119007762 /NCGR_PEP_ID=MMETSP1176-20130426/3232_1 /TAXON_ID=265551 /ORGANISM="Synedropsis recta cf, Strain CCMP1620" /LENGTH=837 /DNA_ID=CAMNT_0006959969 /DNA_START=105 /DNA_END=2618 /DNA_ORIENTATION=-